MALNKQNIPLNLAQLPNQKADPKSLSPGTPTSITNARFQKAGRIDKRYGYSQLTMTDRDATAITGFKKIIGTPDYLLGWAGNEIYSYDSDGDHWESRGPYFAAETTVKGITGVGQSPQSLIDGDYTYYVYNMAQDDASEQQGGNIGLTVVATDTGQVIAGPVVIAELMINPKIIKFNSKIFCTFFSQVAPNIIKGVQIDSTQADWTGTEVTIVSDWEDESAGSTDSYHDYDIYAWADTRLIIAYTDDTTNTTLNIRYFDDTLTALTGAYALRQVTSMGVTRINDVSIIPSSSGDRFFVLGINRDSRAGSAFCIINADGTQNTAATALSITDFSYDITKVYGEAYNNGAADGIKFWVSDCSVDDTDYWIGQVRVHTITDAGSQSNGSQNMNGIALLAPPFTYDSQTYFIAYTGQPNYTLSLVTYDSDGYYTVASLFWGRGRMAGTENTVSPYWRRGGWTKGTVTNPATGVYEVAVAIKDTSSGRLRIVSVEFDFLSDNLFRGVQYADSVYIAGSNPLLFDGASLMEPGFFQAPNPVISTSVSNAGNLADGTYSMILVFEYVTKGGFIIRSAPSNPFSITVSGQGGFGSISFDYVNLGQSNLNRSTTSNNQVYIYPYITEAGGEIYYQAKVSTTSSKSSVVNSWTLGTASTAIVYNVLTTGPILYTDSGEVQSTPIPPLKFVTAWNNRLWFGGDPENAYIYYSKTNQNKIAAEFSEGLTIGLQELPTDVTSIKGFQDKLVVTTRESIFYTFGEGPNNLGAGGDFAELEQVLGVSGAINSDSLVVTTQGLWYHSDKGVYILNQGLQPEYAGASFEDEIGATVVNSLARVDSDTAIFSTGTQLVELDYFFSIWSKTTGITPQSTQIYNRLVYILDDSDQVWVQDDTVYKDGTTSYEMGVETGWISMSGITGYQRLYRVFFVCEYKSVHTLKISLAYDYSSTYLDEVTFDPADAVDDDTYRFQVLASKQKCQSLRIKIEEVIADGTAGTHESLQINYLAIQVGTKRGLPKIKDAQKVGVTNI